MLKITIFAVSVALCYAGPASDIVRPCHFSDFKCIQDNLAANSGCDRHVQGSIPSSYGIPEFRFETPFFNASYIDNNLIYRNHDRCFVSEFFFNMKSDTSVLTVDCPGLAMQSDRTLIQHYTSREDTTYSYKFNGIYPLVRFTITMNHAEKLDICNAFTFADVTALPTYEINPNDVSTANFLSRDLSALFIYERETFFYRGPHFMKTFINNLICDFHCN